MKIFIISGKARSGKTTIANMLKNDLEELGEKTLIIPFATYLKRYMREHLGWDGTKTEWFRTTAQDLGTRVIREKLNDPQFHVRRICEDVKILHEMNAYENFIIDDCRRKNELYETLVQFPYETVSIRVERGKNFKSDLTEEQLKHISEIDLDNFNGFDYYITNDTCLFNLELKINEILFKLQTS